MSFQRALDPHWALGWGLVTQAAALHGPWDVQALDLGPSWATSFGEPGDLGLIVSCSLGWGGPTQSPLGSYCPATNRTCWNTLYLEWDTPYWERREGKSSVPAYFSLRPSSQTWLPPPPAHNQVKFLDTNLILLKVGCPGSVFHFVIMWALSVPSIGLEDITAYI